MIKKYTLQPFFECVSNVVKIRCSKRLDQSSRNHSEPIQQAVSRFWRDTRLALMFCVLQSGLILSYPFPIYCCMN